MAVLVVGSEKNLTQLKGRLFKGRVPKASLEKVHAAVKAANPGVDMERLTPGTVLTIPDMAEVTVTGDLSLDENTKKAIEQAGQQFSAALERAGAASADSLRRSAATRTKVAKVIGSPQVAKATRGNKELASEVKATKVALDNQAELDKARTVATDKALQQWSKNLDELKSLVPD